MGCSRLTQLFAAELSALAVLHAAAILVQKLNITYAKKEVAVEYQSAPSLALLMEPVQAISAMITNVKDYEVRCIHQKLVSHCSSRDEKERARKLTLIWIFSK